MHAHVRATLVVLAALLAGRAAAAPNCPAGWLPAVGTLYDSWPAPGTTECIDYSGCEWAGQFNNIDPGDAKPCNRGAKWLSGGLQPPNYACRFPQSLVKKWKVAATYKLDSALLGRKLQVMVEGAPKRKVTVNVADVCSDDDCDGCCKENTGNKAWKLIDLEKWPASKLLGFKAQARGFDINELEGLPSNEGGQRPGAPEGVIPLCYRDMGPADRIP